MSDLLEPNEADLPAKPAVPEMEEFETTELPGDEPVTEEEFLPEEEAASNDEVDDSEAVKYDGGDIPRPS